MAGYIGSKAVTLSTTAADVAGNAVIDGDLTVKGTTVTIDSAAVQEIRLGDNDKMTFGDATGGDLQIYHDGSHSRISEVGTGSLLIDGDEIYLRSSTGENKIIADTNGGVNLFYDNASKLATTSTGVDITGVTNIDTTGTSGGGKLRVGGLVDITTTSGGAAFRIFDGVTFRGGLGDGDWTGTGDVGDFGIYVGGSSKKMPIHIGSSTPIAAFTSTGLGIGTSSPGETLDVSGNIRAFGANSRVMFGPDGFEAGIKYATDATLQIASRTGENIAFTNGHDGAERMRISSTGKIGINNTSPVEDLHIKGTNPRINVEGDGSSYYPSIRVTGINGGISLGTYYGGNISGNTLSFLTGDNTTDGGTRRMMINSSGRVLVDRTTDNHGGMFCLNYTGGSSAGLVVTDTSSSGTGVILQVVKHDNSIIGSITHNQSSTAYNTSSDYRLKENVTDVTDGITRVKQLAPKRFNFIVSPDITVDGFIAHEVQDVIPEAISGVKDAMRDEEYEVTPAVEATFDEDGNVLTEAVEAVMGTRSVPDYQGIDQSKLVPLLTAALQEAIAKIETLETEMTSVKARLDALETV